MTDSELHNHLARIGANGGRAGSPKQKITRRLNAYRTLAQRYPTSVKVQQTLAKLEREAEESR